VDTSSANNDNGGFYNASNPPNAFAFATLQADGSIKAWGQRRVKFVLKDIEFIRSALFFNILRLYLTS
jgi:hypothetical protein